MIALYRKELRALLPLQLLMILSNSGDVLYRPLSERLDEQGWTDISSYLLPGEGGSFGVVLVVFSLLVAYSLLPREHDEGTIGFLYSLPISRLRIFLTKAAAGWTVLVVGCVVLQITDGLLQSPNHQSFIGEQWSLGVAAKACALQSLVAGFVLCQGLLISFLRRFGLIPYALVGWVILSLEQMAPSFASLNFLNLISFEYEGSRLVIPWAGLGLHLGLSLLSLSAAAALWTGQAERLSALFRRLPEMTGGRLALGCGTVGAVVVIGGLVIAASVGDGFDELEERAEPSERDPLGPDRPSRPIRLETKRFIFTYPQAARDRALRLIEGADELHEQLRRRLGAEVGDPVVVDLTESSSHHEGITAWTTVRVGLLAEPDDLRLRRTFVHELTHALQGQLARRRLGDNVRATRFFTEGSAEYYAQELVPDEELRRALRRTAVVAWSRHRVGFEVLSDDDRLRATQDTLLVYTLGERFTAALVAACGQGAPGAVLRAMGREGAPRDLDPPAFWQDTLRAAGCGLEPVLAAFSALMAGEVEAEAAFLSALPGLGGGVTGGDGAMIRLRATLDRPPLPFEAFPEVAYVVRLRDNPGVGDAQLRAFEGRLVEEGGELARVDFEVPRALVQGQRFQFQLGQRFHPGSWATFEPWQLAATP